MDDVSASRLGTAAVAAASVPPGSRGPKELHRLAQLLQATGGVFAGLSENVLRQACKSMELRELGLGEYLIHEGEPPVELFVVASGRLVTSRSSPKTPWQQDVPSQQPRQISRSSKDTASRAHSFDLPGNNTMMATVSTPRVQPQWSPRRSGTWRAFTGSSLAESLLEGDRSRAFEDDGDALPVALGEKNARVRANARAVASMALMSARMRSSKSPTILASKGVVPGALRLERAGHSATEQAQNKQVLAEIEANGRLNAPLSVWVKALHGTGEFLRVAARGRDRGERSPSPRVLAGAPAEGPARRTVGHYSKDTGSEPKSPARRRRPSIAESTLSQASGQATDVEPEEFTETHFGAGQVVGEEACLRDNTHDFCVEALERSQVLALSTEVLMECMEVERKERRARREQVLFEAMGSLRGLDRDKVDRLVDCFRMDYHYRGEVLCHEGDQRSQTDADRLRIIVEGQARALKVLPSSTPGARGGASSTAAGGSPRAGRSFKLGQSRDVGMLAPGCAVNGASQLLGRPEPCTVVVESAEAVVVSASRSELNRMVHPSTFEGLRAAVEEMCQWHEQRLGDIVASSAGGVGDGSAAARPLAPTRDHGVEHEIPSGLLHATCHVEKDLQTSRIVHRPNVPKTITHEKRCESFAVDAEAALDGNYVRGPRCKTAVAAEELHGGEHVDEKGTFRPNYRDRRVIRFGQGEGDAQDDVADEPAGGGRRPPTIQDALFRVPSVPSAGDSLRSVFLDASLVGSPSASKTLTGPFPHSITSSAAQLRDYEKMIRGIAPLHLHKLTLTADCHVVPIRPIDPIDIRAGRAGEPRVLPPPGQNPAAPRAAPRDGRPRPRRRATPTPAPAPEPDPGLQVDAALSRRLMSPSPVASSPAPKAAGSPTQAVEGPDAALEVTLMPEELPWHQCPQKPGAARGGAQQQPGRRPPAEQAQSDKETPADLSMWSTATSWPQASPILPPTARGACQDLAARQIPSSRRFATPTSPEPLASGSESPGSAVRSPTPALAARVAAEAPAPRSQQQARAPATPRSAAPPAPPKLEWSSGAAARGAAVRAPQASCSTTMTLWRTTMLPTSCTALPAVNVNSISKWLVKAPTR